MRKYLPYAVMLSLLLAGGCSGSLGSAVATLNPRFTETMSKAPSLGPDTGRIVLFFPASEPSGTGDASFMHVEVDGSYEANVSAKTFLFIDLPADQHNILLISGGSQPVERAGHYTLKAGETKFVDVGHLPPAEIAPDRALPLVSSLHHGRNVSLPFNQKSG